MREHRHAKRNPGEQCVEPPATQRAVEQHRQDTHNGTNCTEHPDDSSRLHLQPRGFGFHRTQRLANLSDFAVRADGDHFADRGPTHNQRTRKYIRQVIAAGPALVRYNVVPAGNLAYRYGLARQQRFVGLHIVTANKNRIGRDAIALYELDDVAAHDLAPRNAFARAVANHQRARTGQVAQRLQHPFGARFLNHSDRNGHQRESEQNQRVLEVTQHQVDRTAAKQ